MQEFNLRFVPVLLTCSVALHTLPAVAVDADAAKAVLKLAPDAAAVGDLIKDVTQDMPIGTPSAAVLLGASANQVPRVTSFRDAALTLSNGIGKDGKLTQAVGAEFLPATALNTLRWEALKNPFMRTWARTSVSFASLPSEKSGSARTALGVQTVLYSKEADEAIAAATSQDCTAIARRAVDEPAKPASPGDPTPQIFSAKDQDLLAACMQLIDHTLNRWNPTTVAVGAGQAYFSSDARLSSLSSSATSWWVTAAWGMDFDNIAVAAPFRKGVGITGHWRQSHDERVADPADASKLRAESAALWALNLRLGTPRVAALAEVSRRTASLTGLPDERRQRSFLGAELRVAEGLYFALGLASDRGARDGTEQRAALANIKWGFGDKQVLGGR